MTQENNISSNNKKLCQEEDFDVNRKVDEKEKELIAEGVRRVIEEYGDVLKKLGDN